MIRVLIGDLFQSKAQTLVNTVNCVGVMGAGIALEFKKRFPEYCEDYRKRCDRHEVRLGVPYLYRRLDRPWILSFPTKDHWRSMTRLDDIVAGMQYLVAHYREWGIESIAVPPLGSGHGQLEWRIVGPTLYRHLKELKVPVELYAPYGIPESEVRLEFLENASTSDRDPQGTPNAKWVQPGWVGIVEILRRVTSQPHSNPVGRTMLQKIAYLATEENLPTGLHFTKGPFGPFSPDLKMNLTRLVNNGMIEEQPYGRMLRVSVGRTFDDARRSYRRELGGWEPTIDRIVDLAIRTRMNTATAEIVTSIIFAARRLDEIQGGSLSETEVVKAVMDWKRGRREPMDESRVADLVRILAGLGWIQVTPSRELRIPAIELDIA